MILNEIETFFSLSGILKVVCKVGRCKVVVFNGASHLNNKEIRHKPIWHFVSNVSCFVRCCCCFLFYWAGIFSGRAKSRNMHKIFRKYLYRKMWIYYRALQWRLPLIRCICREIEPLHLTYKHFMIAMRWRKFSFGPD